MLDSVRHGRFEWIMSDISLSPIIPTLIQQGIGVGLISIFLTAIVFIYTAAKEGMQDWDRSVILEKVVNVKDFLIYLSFIFIPPFFWDLGVGFQIAIILFAALGVVYLVYQLRNIYLWITDLEGSDSTAHLMAHLPLGYRQLLREEYLTEAIDVNRMRIWSMTWGQKTNPGVESRLMTSFFKQVTDMAQNNEWLKLKDYLQIYNAGRSNREVRYWHNTRVALEALLVTHYREYVAVNSSDDNHDHIYCGNLISELVSFYINAPLTSGVSFVVFDVLKNHLSGRNESYTQNFISDIHQILFESIVDSKSGHSIWNHHFPEEWKVTEEHLRDNAVARSMFRSYIEWLQTRIGSKDDWDKLIDEVSRELLPGLYPSWWAELITYLIRPFGDSRIMSLFETAPNFGFIGHTHGGINIPMEDLERQMIEATKRERQDTITFFLKHFSIDQNEIASSLIELANIEPKDEKEELRKRKLLEIFRAVFSNQPNQNT